MPNVDNSSNPARPPIRWEFIDCPLCEAQDEELVLTAPDEIGEATYRLVRCRRCGMGYVNPRPAPVSMGRFYPDDYHPYQARDTKKTGLIARLTRLVLSTYYRYPTITKGLGRRLLAGIFRPWLAPEVGSHRSVPFTGRGRLLDYGCGSGWFAHGMREWGWDVTGMDFSDASAAFARKNYGLRVLVGTLPHAEVQPESYDVVNMGAVLEHVHWPHETIGAAVKALRPGGRLVVSVPNLDGWCIHTFGAQAHTVQLPRHLLHFTPRTLQRLLSQHGLQVEQFHVQGKESWLRHTFDTVLNAETSTGPRWLAAIGRRRVMTRFLTRWISRRKCGDYLFAIARKASDSARHSAAA